MRDVKLVTDNDNRWGVDLDIVDGEPAYLDEAAQTNDQRAAVACYMCKGTVPGLPEAGVSWGAVYDKSITSVQLNNELAQQLDTYVGSSSEQEMLTSTQYNAMLLEDSGGVGVLVQRGGQ